MEMKNSIKGINFFKRLILVLSIPIIITVIIFFIYIHFHLISLSPFFIGLIIISSSIGIFINDKFINTNKNRTLLNEERMLLLSLYILSFSLMIGNIVYLVIEWIYI